MEGGIHVRLSVDGVGACPVAALSTEVAVESIVSGGPRADGGAVGEATVTDLPEDPSIPDDVDAVFTDGSRAVYRFEADGDCPCTRLPANGCPVRDVRAEGGTLRVSFIAPCVETVRAIVADLRSTCETVRVRRLARSAPGEERTLVLVDRSAFTDRQYEVLRTAHEMGYFERPKEATSDDVAAELGISVATFSEHLATTQTKLLDQLLAGRADDDANRSDRTRTDGGRPLIDPNGLARGGIRVTPHGRRTVMSETIYREIGGRDAVEDVVDDFYDRVLSDERLAEYFDGLEMEELRAHQVQFLSTVAEGPADYSGGDMREAHDHLDIDEADFDAVASHLERALRTNGVGRENAEAIMAEVANLKDPILDR